MRRIVLGLAITLAAIAPTMTFADDHQIAKSIAEALKSQKDAGNLRGFKINLQVDQGTVWLKGHVADDEQSALADRIANATEGVKQVVNDLSVTAATPAPKKFSLSRVTRLRMPKPQTQEQANGNRGSTEPVSTRRQAPTRAASLEEPVLPIEPIANQDDEIARTVFGRLTQAKKAGDLRHFKLDMNVVNGTVWLDGHVTLPQHKELALDIASRVKGVVQVVDNISIQATPVPVIAASTTNASSQRPASPTRAPAGPAPIYRATAQVQPVAQTQPLQPVVQQLQPVQQVQQMQVGQPVPMQPVVQQLQPVQQVQQVQVGQPVPMQMMGYPSYGTGIAAARYDHPNLPQYAWPSYAAHPNYAAVSYPQQYSPSAWPYIGPFHPYPQVPLGWRKVELKWKDGWWMLDFKSK